MSKREAVASGASSIKLEPHERQNSPKAQPANNDITPKHRNQKRNT